MIKPREGTMDVKKEEELAFYYMFIAACLTEEQLAELKIKFNENGGHQKESWWRFVMNNTKIELDII